MLTITVNSKKFDSVKFLLGDYISGDHRFLVGSFSYQNKVAPSAYNSNLVMRKVNWNEVAIQLPSFAHKSQNFDKLHNCITNCIKENSNLRVIKRNTNINTWIKTRDWLN